LVDWSLMRFDPILSSVLADLSVNLSAGWVGALVIVPNFSKERGARRLLILTVDILAAIVCLIIAFVLKKLL
jgi:hypothetical protein